VQKLQEERVTIISTVVSRLRMGTNQGLRLGLVSNAKLFNVATTRAKVVQLFLPIALGSS
jgi:hypothetical protein